MILLTYAYNCSSFSSLISSALWPVFKLVDAGGFTTGNRSLSQKINRATAAALA